VNEHVKQIVIGIESDAKVLLISVAARMAGMHPQTLRQYDRLGLVQPGRSSGGGRRYSPRDVALLREIQRLSQDDGVNLAGIKRIIDLEQLVAELQETVAELQAELSAAHQRIEELEATTFPRRDLVPLAQSQAALVVWRPRRSTEPARVAHEAAFAPVVVVEQLGPGQQHPDVVCPDDRHLVAVVLGVLDELAQPASRVRPEVGADAVRRVDVHAVQRETAGRTAWVHGEIEERSDESVTGNEQIPVLWHGLQQRRVGMVGPGAQLCRGGVDRVREAAERRWLNTHC
jgi:MerR family transcriptional regulator/heat shock protein HspR